MHNANKNLESVHRFWFFWLPLMTGVTVFLGLLVCVRVVLSRGTVQPAYTSAEQASQALYQAVQNDNQRAISQILGGQDQLTSSGYELEDKGKRKLFATEYQEMHRLVRQSDGSMELYIGAENWPLPARLISDKGKWRFDAGAGTQEIVSGL